MKKTIMLITVLVGLLLISGCATNTSPTEKLVYNKENGTVGNVSNFVGNESLYGPTEHIANYSIKGFITVHPEEEEKIIMMECINSTLFINETMIGCVK